MDDDWQMECYHKFAQLMYFTYRYIWSSTWSWTLLDSELHFVQGAHTENSTIITILNRFCLADMIIQDIEDRRSDLLACVCNTILVFFLHICSCTSFAHQIYFYSIPFELRTHWILSLSICVCVHICFLHSFNFQSFMLGHRVSPGASCLGGMGREKEALDALMSVSCRQWLRCTLGRWKIAPWNDTVADGRNPKANHLECIKLL